MAGGAPVARHRVALSPRTVLPIDVLVLRLPYLGGPPRRADRGLSAALRCEIELVSKQIDRRIKVDHIHFGGGTPTIMAPETFLRSDRHRSGIRFFVLPSAEIAVEIDPRTLTPAMIDALGSGGVNRASLGVQSFDPWFSARSTGCRVSSRPRLRPKGCARRHHRHQFRSDLRAAAPDRRVVPRHGSPLRRASGPTVVGVRLRACAAFKKHQRKIDEAVAARRPRAP